ncbi:ferric-chelate reductase 1-like [Lineus longissimus]|uniref:ferric-chelate reductase 1-like n=1 Tax=Lineus longissimus TaxID=88925 RepID=UPI002B4F24D9
MAGRAILLLSLLASCQHLVMSKPNGAPSSACINMVPQHRVDPQTSKAPFTIEISKSKYAVNEPVEVTLLGTGGEQFEGFLLEARRVDPNAPGGTSELIGTFAVPAGLGSEVKTTCPGSKGNGLTHAKQQKRSSLKVTWTAPSGKTEGHLEFRATFVKNIGTFWINVKSPILDDPSAAPLPSPTPATFDPIKQIVTNGECGVTKGCFLHPAECTESTCEYLLTYRVNGDYVDFEMSAKTSGYISVGFSYNQKMDLDSVIDCIYDSQVPSVNIQHSYNGGKNNEVIANAKTGLSNMTGYFFKDRVSCRFRRLKVITNNAKIYSLDQKYYVLLARGKSSGGLKLRHDLSILPKISTQEVDVKSLSSVSGGGGNYGLAKAHGCLMVLAWVFFASFGMLSARYYKTMWPNAGLCSEKVWFAVHRFCMSSAVILTCIAFILIFVMNEGYSYGLEGLPHKAHPILGIIVTILCILNPLIALCRPHPKDKNRPIFNWVHWAIGTITHILAIVTMFIGLDLGKAETPWYATWFLVAFVIFHCCVELILEIHQCCTARRNHEKAEEFEMEKERRPRDYLNEPSPSGRFFKMFFYILHAVVVGGLAIVLVLMIAIGRDKLG